VEQIINYPYVIAEIGINHEGDIGKCIEMVHQAKKSGCDAVKIQSFDPDDLTTSAGLKVEIPLKGYEGITLEKLLKKSILSDSDTAVVSNECKKIGIEFISTPLGFRQVDMLEDLVDRFKIASMDVNNHKLLEIVAKKGKPIIMSLGMATLEDIDQAVRLILEHNTQLSLLHCVSQYPPDDEELNINRIDTINKIFDLPVGFSDHTNGITASLVATTLGAVIIEKHFTFDKTRSGYDHFISADYSEMTSLCTESKRVKTLMGDYKMFLTSKEKDQAKLMKRSIFIKRDMKAGETISVNDLEFKRPGTGIPPSKVSNVVGREVAMDLSKEKMIDWRDLH